MKRNYNNILKQFMYGIKTYHTDNIETFLNKKNLVKHGKNGIGVSIEGNYRFKWSPKLIQDRYTGYFENTGIYIDNLEDPLWGELNQFPYSKSNELELRLNPEIFIKLNPNKLINSPTKHIYSPKIWFNKNMEDYAILVDFLSTPIKKTKKVDLKKLLLNPKLNF